MRTVILKESLCHCLDFETSCDEGWPCCCRIPDDENDAEERRETERERIRRIGFSTYKRLLLFLSKKS